MADEHPFDSGSAVARSGGRFADLIARLKVAEPDRDLDRDIIFATFPRDRVAVFDGVKHISTMTGADGQPWFNPLADRHDCPRYTGSIDDAIELLPSKLVVRSTLCSDGTLQIIEAWFDRDEPHLDGLEIVTGHGDTICAKPAIALCILALRALDHV